MSGSITKQKLIAGLITAALATGAVGSAVYAGSLFGLGGSEEKAEEVQLAMVETKDIENTINVTGALASASENSASVSAKDAELIVKDIKVKVGDTVKAGDVLFTLDTNDLEISLGQAEMKLAVLERKNEIAARRLMQCPPFTHLGQVIIQSRREDNVTSAAKQMAELMRNYAKGKSIEILGPSPAQLFRINNVFRWKLLIKCAEEDRLRNFVRYTIDRFKERSDLARYVVIMADIDPMTIQ